MARSDDSNIQVSSVSPEDLLRVLLFEQSKIRPMSVYFAEDAIAFLPVLPQEKKKMPVAPLMMHTVTTHGGDKHNHWATIKLKRSIKLKWPAIDKSELYPPFFEEDEDLNLTDHENTLDWMAVNPNDSYDSADTHPNRQ
ncbi:hypothetical protein PS6_005297 [Mucor atramentarius]